MYSDIYTYKGGKPYHWAPPPDSFISRVATCVAGNPFEVRLGWAEVRAFVDNWIESEDIGAAALQLLAPRRGDPRFLQRILESPLMLGAFCHRCERWGAPSAKATLTTLLVETVTAWLIYPQPAIYTGGVYAQMPKLTFYKALAQSEQYYFDQELVMQVWGRTQVIEAPPALNYDILTHGLLRPETGLTDLKRDLGLDFQFSVSSLYEILPLLNELPELLAGQTCDAPH